MTVVVRNIVGLLETAKMYEKHKPAPKDYMQKTFHDKPVLQAILPNYARTEILSKMLNLITVKGNDISMTNLGKKTLEFYEAKNPQFDEFFIKHVLFGSKMAEIMHNAISQFYENGDSLWYPKAEIYTIFKIQDLLPILYEINLLEKKDKIVEINPKYIVLVLQRKKITQKQLEVQLRHQKIVGEIAEEITLDFERKKLIANGCMDESEKIEQISQKFANAGYDIESFTKGENGYVYKIYIEVKGSSGEELDFYISVNELKKAQEYNEKYWIYFVPGIDVRTRTSAKEIITIQNPAKEFFNNSKYIAEVEKYHILQNIS